MQPIINPKILSIEEFKIPDFFSDFIYIYKLVSSIVEITIDNSKWNIPFQYIFSKERKSIYSQGKDGYCHSEQIDGYYKMRILNQPLFELQNFPNFNELLNILFHFDTNFIKEIDNSQFNKISVSDLFFHGDEWSLDNFNHFEYEVRLYPNIVKFKDAFFIDKRHWDIPHISLSNFDFPDEMTQHFNFPKQVCNINIVPKNYRCSFHKIITSENDLHSAKFFNRSKYYSLYTGKYGECKNFFDNKEALKKIATSELIKHIESPQVDDYNDSDYFDAMTDGQLGNYDDFIEGGGNIDGIDTWSGG